MIERPILFSGPLVKAILAGTKTVTRRIVKWPTWADAEEHWPQLVSKGALAYMEDGRPRHVFTCPFGAPGDRLWVKERFAFGAAYDKTPPGKVPTEATPVYCADGVDRPFRGKLRPSIHMPRWASRLTLEVTSVSVERLQRITHAEAVAEGVENIEAFAAKWDELNGDRASWATDPWVWRIGFSVVREGGR